jgi:hypothetical protein
MTASQPYFMDSTAEIVNTLTLVFRVYRHMPHNSFTRCVFRMFSIRCMCAITAYWVSTVRDHFSKKGAEWLLLPIYKKTHMFLSNSKNIIPRYCYLRCLPVVTVFLLSLKNPCVIYFITPNEYCDDLKLST